MLAPLKDRSILELDPGDDLSFERTPLPDNDHAELVLALREARRALRLSAMTSTRKIIEQTNEIDRLNEQNAALTKRLNELESGVAITRLGQKLMSLTTRNEQLTSATERICFLDKALCLARTECDYLVQEYEIPHFNLDN